MEEIHFLNYNQSEEFYVYGYITDFYRTGLASL